LLWAYDRVKREIVHAEDARRARARYQCPNGNCRALVKLYPSGERQAHFKHYSHAASAECLDFHPSNYAHQTSSPARYVEDERLQVQRLGLELKIWGRKRDEWGLQLRIPKLPACSGAVTLRRGPGAAGLQQVSLAVLREKTQRFDVVPCGLPLGVIEFSNPRAALQLQEQLQTGLVQLSLDRCKVFHASGLNRYNAVGTTIYWGTSYYFIWDALDGPPPPENLCRKYLSLQHGWKCAMVSIPGQPEQGLEEQLRDSTGLSMAERRASFSVLMPPFAIDAGRPEVLLDSSENVLLSVECRDGVLDDCLSVESQSGLQEVKLNAVNAAFFLLRQDDGKRGCFLVRFGTEPGVLIDTSGKVDQKASALRVRVTTERGNEAIAPFYSAEARRLLDATRKGLCHDAKIEAWDPCRGLIKWRSGQGSQSSEAVLSAGDDAPNRYKTLSTPGLNDVLLEKNAEVTLDFYGHGFQYLPPSFEGEKGQPDHRLSPIEIYISCQSPEAPTRYHGLYTGETWRTRRADPMTVHRRYAENANERASADAFTTSKRAGEIDAMQLADSSPPRIEPRRAASVPQKAAKRASPSGQSPASRRGTKNALLKKRISKVSDLMRAPTLRKRK